jgi:hypothetical protein
MTPEELMTNFANKHSYDTWDELMYDSHAEWQIEYTKRVMLIYARMQAKKLSLSDVMPSLPDDNAINQVACDEMQQDWNDLKFQKVYKDGYIDGATWLRNNVKQAMGL